MEKSHCVDHDLNIIKHGEDDVVISGIAGKFPDSENVYHFRDNLFNKIDLVSDDTRRWKPFHHEIPQRTGKLFNIDKFDSGFFGVTGNQANHMDPLVRMCMELCMEGIIDAGYNPEDIANTKTAVITGACFAETEKYALYESLIHSSDSITGVQRSMISKRISHALRLKGPSMIVDTACSSSLFALEHGYSLIKSGKCDKALVCGGNLCLHPFVSLQFARLGVLSPDGSCKSFDDAGNGYARSEGIVVCLLEKAKDAKRVYAKMLHAKTNCDGFKREGITFPSANLQKVLFQDFYSECKIDPRLLTYMEAHGTGTAVGDPEELKSLDEFFCTNRDRPLYIGAVKSNIGHNEPTSGLCSVVKTILAMETGYIPPNLHYKKPREGVDALQKGRMIVVTEKTPLPDDRGIFGVNSFGFGGANAHILLHWNPKAKANNGQPKDYLPRLICVSSRTEEGINLILDNYENTNLDAEYAYLIQQVFSKPLINNTHRGYGIYNKTGETRRSSTICDRRKRKLRIIFTNFEKKWFKLRSQLLDIPAFAETIKRFRDILLETDNLDLYEILDSDVQERSMGHILGAVAIQIALANTFKEINLSLDQVFGLRMGKFTAAHINNSNTLRQTISNIFNNIPSNGDILFDTNDLESVDDIIYLIIGDDLKQISQNSIHLINPNSVNYTNEVLNTIGRLYELGFDMELDKLYPSIKLPVSRSTPMLSPLLRWNHNKSWNVHLYKSDESKAKDGHRVMHIYPRTEHWAFLTGHVIDGRNLFPATGYLILAWEAFAMLRGKLLSSMKIIFEDVKLLRATHIHKDTFLELLVSIQVANDGFSISEGGTVVVTGKIYDRSNEEVNFHSVASFDESQLCLTEKDIYKELKIRGYHYTGKFRNIKKCNINCSRAIVEWDRNWIPFVDSLLQLSLMQADTRNTYVPTTIQYLSIDAPKHTNATLEYQNMLPVELLKDFNIVRTDGIEIRGLGPAPIPRRKGGEPVLETYKFVPYEASLEINDSVRSLVQLILENSNTVQVKIVELLLEDKEENDLICPIMQKALQDLPLIRQEVIVLSKKSIELANATIQNKPLEAESNVLILILSNILETTEIPIALNVIKEAKGFIISREHLKADQSKFNGSPLQVLSTYKTKEETLVLLKPFGKTQSNIITLDVSDPLDKFEWIPELQSLLKTQNKIILYSQNNPISGLLGLVNCVRCEAHRNKLFGFFIMDEAPPFDINLDFYKEQLGKNLTINIWKDGAWGMYRHLLLPQADVVENVHCYVNVIAKGDLSTLTWIEGNIKRDDPSPSEKELVHIYYAALNFRDLMTASGKLIPDAITKDRIAQECIQGFEFSGRNSKGERIMGISQSGALASMTICNKNLISPIPTGWTMEDAATIPVVYGTVLQVLTGKGIPKPGQSILIHSGTGGIGLAAINLSLHFGLTIFVTVGTEEKCNFIKKHYPQIKHEHIGNSRDLSFELMIEKYTGGKGVDYVLNSLAEDKLLASVRCLAKGGNFLEIGKFDLASNNALVLKLLEKEATFMGLAIDKFLTDANASVQIKYNNIIKDYIKNGAIKPLPRTIFEENEVEKAFRYMGTGKHIGKILIKILNEEDEKIYPVPRRRFKCLARFHCNPESSYIILGGLGGFGLELTDWLVVRGAKKLILTSKSGLCNGYQKYRLRIWKSYGVEILTNTIDASTADGCSQLLNISNNLGPVDGIFNLAAVLKDSLFENQTVENFKISFSPKAQSVRHLDVISRELCPTLRYFVVFSSISCGRGNAGQTNYGMANSIMERICEKRKLEGYPALAIEWGAIGEVGLVAKMQEDHKELVIGGTLQQRISSCLEVLDKLLNQDDPVVASMLVAEKRYGASADNLFGTVLQILGITNLKIVSAHTSFPELGMDSMMAVEIKQTLEREYETFLTAQDIKEMTLSKLKDISNAREDRNINTTASQDDLPADITMLLRHVGAEEQANIPVIEMKTLIEGNEYAPHIIALPGVEGRSTVLEPLCKRLKARVSCLQYCNDSKSKTVEEIALTILPYVEGTKGDVIILAYSYGTIVGIELIRFLELAGRKCRVIFIDGAPQQTTAILQTYFGVDDEATAQITLIRSFMARYTTYDYVAKHQQSVMNHISFEDKINYMIRIFPKIDLSTKFIKEFCISSYNRLSALLKYKPEGSKLKSNVTLFKPTSVALTATADDYGLSKFFENPVDVVRVDGNHVTILDNGDLSNRINSISKVWSENIIMEQ